jgi:hypothetical protein
MAGVTFTPKWAAPHKRFRPSPPSKALGLTALIAVFACIVLVYLFVPLG